MYHNPLVESFVMSIIANKALQKKAKELEPGETVAGTELPISLVKL